MIFLKYSEEEVKIMKNIKLVYQYDGTDFFGMQKQNNQRTVAGEIEKALKFFYKEEINLINSGRTDRGVHALYQVSNFKTDGKIPADKLKYALAKALPKDINLIDACDADDDFNARFSAKWRSYLYKLNSKSDIFSRNRVMFVEEEINIDRFNEILKPLLGIHDFGSFRKADCGAQNGIREIYEIYAYNDGADTVIYLRANSFLKSMVRIIVGSALAIYFGKKPEDYIIQKLKNPDKQENGKIMAEAQGLYLYEVKY